MAKAARKRNNKALERRKAKRKRAGREQRRRRAVVGDWAPPEAAQWPLLECCVNEDWRNVGVLVRVVVARRAPDGLVAAALFAIDLGCLGGKDGFTRVLTPAMYRELRDGAMRPSRGLVIPHDLAAKIVRGGIGYARSLGFSPHPDALRATKFLGDARPDDCVDPVPLGDGKGRPQYIQGPFDDPVEVIATLRRKVGRDGFGYVCALDGDDLSPGLI